MINKNNLHKQLYSRGAVSLFVVIFTALLFVTVTVGFTVLMLSNQQQSTNNDLAQSALDSAQAGTEDAKRVLAQLADCEERGIVTTDPCHRIKTAVMSHDCNTVNHALGVSADSERLIAESEDDKKLQQAYTCVKINTQTDSYLGKTKDEGEIRMIPLRAAGEFNHIRVSWLSPDDLDDGEALNLHPLTNPNNGHTTTGGPEPATTALPTKQKWVHDDHRGAVLRVQSLQYTPGAVNLTDMDNNQRTVFLYPANTNSHGPNTVGASTIDLGQVDQHHAITPTDRSAPAGMDTSLGTNVPQKVKCTTDKSVAYMCSTDIILPNPVTANSNFSYLTLASFYRQTSFKVELIDSSDHVVKFNNVQPEIDATGRANDVLRRIVSRVESADANQAPYPRAEVGTVKSMCKNFVVTDDPDDFHDYTDEDTTTTCPNIVTLEPVK